MTPGEGIAGSPPQSGGLRKDISRIQLFTYSFGFLVGFGWIILTGQWINTGGSGGAAIAFLLGGLLLIPVGLCYVELATAFPYPGGEFVYAYHAFGKGLAFIAGWVLLFLFTSLTAFETVAAAWIITVLYPPAAGPPLYNVLGFDVTQGMAVIMVIGMAAITWINYRGSKTMATAQDGVTWVLVITTVAIIASGLLFGEAANLQPILTSAKPEWLWFGTASVFITTPIWYAGINALPQALSELKGHLGPRTLPRLVSVMLVGSSLFYVLIILAVAMSSPRDELTGADFATAFAIGQVLDSEIAVKLVLFAGLLGILSTWNAAHFAASRVLYALSRSHLIASKFSELHPRFGCPHVATLFVGACGLAAASGGIPMIGAIVSSGVIVVSILFFLSCISLFRLRRTDPAASSRYRVPGYPWLPLFGLGYAACTVIFSLTVTWSTRTPGKFPVEWLVLFIWSVLGVFMWLATRKRRECISELTRSELIRNEDSSPARTPAARQALESG